MAFDPVDLPGAADIVKWFGCWPSFHDAEILQLNLDRSGPSILKLITWNLTDTLDAKGYFVLEKHAVVSFTFDRVLNLDLKEFNHQNVIFGLEIEKIELGHRLMLEPCFGLHGSIDVENLRVQARPTNM